MSKKIVKATLRWLRSEEGGRKSFPKGPRYSTLANFAGRTEGWPQQGWSVVVDFLEPVNADGVVTVALGFLIDENAPEDVLVPSATFELMEGARIVARGIVSPEG